MLVALSLPVSISFHSGHRQCHSARVHFAYLASMLARGLDDPAGTGINDRCDTTGLRINKLGLGMITRKGLCLKRNGRIFGAEMSAAPMLLVEELPCQRFAFDATICRLMVLPNSSTPHATDHRNERGKRGNLRYSLAGGA